ncbi:hypothetical protein CDA47_04275 [Salmonella enterica subsp. enterica serovar Infantis]|nr:hypothetical protein R570_09465 [Salmonella enterica subsp. enterica serovar Infantis]OSY31693.1 hypothetical protein B6G21_15175 [Salmonella enterica subsp. enterica serovar Infantis]PAB75227.1 hypothetical protein CDA47_04275 [Salmonella enterica subsp. enterica serovar Infantis]
MVFSVIKLPIILYTLHTSSGLCVGYGLLGPSMGLALTGRCSPQSHRYLCLGTHSLAAFKQLELFWLYIPL